MKLTIEEIKRNQGRNFSLDSNDNITYVGTIFLVGEIELKFTGIYKKHSNGEEGKFLNKVFKYDEFKAIRVN